MCLYVSGYTKYCFWFSYLVVPRPILTLSGILENMMKMMLLHSNIAINARDVFKVFSFLMTTLIYHISKTWYMHSWHNLPIYSKVNNIQKNNFLIEVTRVSYTNQAFIPPLTLIINYLFPFFNEFTSINMNSLLYFLFIFSLCVYMLLRDFFK